MKTYIAGFPETPDFVDWSAKDPIAHYMKPLPKMSVEAVGINEVVIDTGGHPITVKFNDLQDAISKQIQEFRGKL